MNSFISSFSLLFILYITSPSSFSSLVTSITSHFCIFFTMKYPNPDKSINFFLNWELFLFFFFLSLILFLLVFIIFFNSLKIKLSFFCSLFILSVCIISSKSPELCSLLPLLPFETEFAYLCLLLALSLSFSSYWFINWEKSDTITSFSLFSV